MKKKKKKSLLKTVFGCVCCTILVLAVLIVGYFGITALRDPYDMRILDGVTIGGLDVGGMTQSEARNALTTALDNSLYAQPLSVKLPRGAISLTAKSVSASVNVRDAVSDAYACGRDPEAAEHQFSLLPYLKLDEAKIRDTLAQYAASTDTELIQPQWTLEGIRPGLSTDTFQESAEGQTLVLTMGIPSVHLDIDQIYGEILAAYEQVIPMCDSDSFAITPEVEPDAVPDALDLESIYGEVSVPAVDDSLDLETYAFVPGSYGYGFAVEEAQALVAEAAYGETLRIPLTHTEPEILGDGVYFREVLGHCETKHTDDENRNTNLRLLCEALDGVILQPGEEFSYNETVGERTEEKGYKPATAYSGKTMIKDIGGGVCQGSTTLYNCALLADLEILERVCHGAKVGYVPLGLDAAVNWNTKTDLRFKNNFHFPMMIKAEVSDGYVKMQLLGTDEKDYYIEMRCGQGQEGDILYAVSYKVKYDKETGEQISKEREANSTYYPLG